MPGFLTNDLPVLTQISGNMRIPVDTEFPRGSNPASVAGTALQIAGTFAEAMANPSTSTAGAVTSNVLGGLITTEALATAPNTNYTFTLTNNLITAAYLAAGNVPEVGMYSGSNTGGGIPPAVMSAVLTLQSTTPGVGNVVFVWQNQGASALNGTMRIVWHL
jgi:hypothetical protein